MSEVKHDLPKHKIEWREDTVRACSGVWAVYQWQEAIPKSRKKYSRRGYWHNVANLESKKYAQEFLDSLYPERDRWTTEELRAEFDVKGFAFGFCIAVRKSDGVKGSLDFDHSPRVYYSFCPDS
jgi:hypothetical protein